MHQNGLSTRQLANRGGVHHSFIDHLLSGRRDTCAERSARRIAAALHTPVSVLFTSDFGRAPEVPK
ncbi:helix-turn-helix domain-containing protein [Nocardia sp. CDC159]|uniref:Helix-turn-helix domain-containing protein n=2 Tax=Nocardiaceae TaxID=85025 RepID=A0A9X2EB96_9NOCA|nr:helix-turn-helix domain-containing protein [Nocardia pulmonis]MCM6790634.1 helix-turn-helix domain-containing protein [Nocardia sp. CDC159]